MCLLYYEHELGQTILFDKVRKAIMFDTENELKDDLSYFKTEDLPYASIKTNISLHKNATPIMSKMFKIAIHYKYLKLEI